MRDFGIAVGIYMEGKVGKGSIEEVPSFLSRALLVLVFCTYMIKLPMIFALFMAWKIDDFYFLIHLCKYFYTYRLYLYSMHTHSN
jgi:hypothetical protein